MKSCQEKVSWFTRKTWAEISKSALVNNLDYTRSLVTEPGVTIMPVVKADAYGHCADLVVPLLEEAGVSCLAVATLDEALALRRSGSRSQILILGTSPVECLPYLKGEDLTQTLVSRKEVAAYSRASAGGGGPPLKVHLKLDTGMTRLGLPTDPGRRQGTLEAMREASLAPGLQVTGVYSHLASADTDPDYTAFQQQAFTETLEAAEALGFPRVIRHLAASSAIAGQPDKHFDMVRPGIVLYGGKAGPSPEAWSGLRPVMTVKSVIEQISEVKAGSRVSYGGTWTADRDSVLAVVNMGYADGLPRLLSNQGAFYHRGRKAPIRGRVCMDRCMVDVTGFSDLEAGDEVMFFGDDGFIRVDAAPIAQLIGTIDYEIYTNIHERVPRLLAD